MTHTEELLQTGAVSAAFLSILLGLGFLQQEYVSGAFTDPVLVVIALIPILFFLATTGRLQRFSGGGFEIVLQEQARKFVSPDASEKIEVEPQRLDAKIRTSELDKIKQRSPTALTFELEKQGFYSHGAIETYLETLDTLRYVVFTDADDRFCGYSTVSDFRRLTEHYTVDVVDEIESGEILDRGIVRTGSIPSDSTNEDGLRAMDARDIDEMAVVNPDGRFVGVVTQDAIIRKLMSSALTEV